MTILGIANDYPAIFVDWLTAGQRHQGETLPLVHGGVVAKFDASGTCVFERGVPARFAGSHDTSVGISCDIGFVGLSGNVGRFGRKDNLFNLGWSATVAKAGRILQLANLPSFRPGCARPSAVPGGPEYRRDWPGRGATLARVDLTCNFAAGSDARARAVIRWLGSQSIARAKRGFSGDESVWWSNTRYMLKAYRKGAEMSKHGGDKDLVDYCTDNGVVRVEVELKRRELEEMGLRDFSDITQEKLEAAFHERMEPFRRADCSHDPDLVASLPRRVRAIAMAWLSGQDVRICCSESTLYRHAKVLREYGLDILEHRNIERFPVKVQVIDLVPLSVPDWYLKRQSA